MGTVQCRGRERSVPASWPGDHREGSEKPCWLEALTQPTLGALGGKADCGWVPGQRSPREVSKQRGEKPRLRTPVGFLETFWTFEKNRARMKEFTGPQSNDGTTQTTSHPEAVRHCHEEDPFFPRSLWLVSERLALGCSESLARSGGQASFGGWGLQFRRKPNWEPGCPSGGRLLAV